MHCWRCVLRPRPPTSTVWRCSLTRALGVRPRISPRSSGTQAASPGLFKTGLAWGSASVTAYPTPFPSRLSLWCTVTLVRLRRRSGKWSPLSALAARRRPVWTSLWNASCTAAASPAARRLARRGHCCNFTPLSRLQNPCLHLLMTKRPHTLTLSHILKPTHSVRTHTQTLTVTYTLLQGGRTSMQGGLSFHLSFLPFCPLF